MIPNGPSTALYNATVANRGGGIYWVTYRFNNAVDYSTVDGADWVIGNADGDQFNFTGQTYGGDYVTVEYLADNPADEPPNQASFDNPGGGFKDVYGQPVAGWAVMLPFG